MLFVGRVIANKKIEDLIRFFHAYHTFYNPRARLLIVGAQSGFERYVASLHQLVATLGAKDVHFIGHVSDEELVAFYEVADLFLCASEHEGFCVPLVEAFYKQAPVLAYAATAVPATMDGAGVLYDDKDPIHVATLMDAIVSDTSLQDRIVDGQLAAVDRLRSKDFAGTLLHFVDEMLARPRAPQPSVSTAPRWRHTLTNARRTPSPPPEKARPDAVVLTPPRSGSGTFTFHTCLPVETSMALTEP